MVFANLQSRSNYFFHLACVSGGGPYESPRTFEAKEYFSVLRSVDLHFKEHIQKFLLSILKKLLMVGSSAPPHLDFGMLRFRTNIIGILLKHFDKYYCMILT